jgi:hypothetical protein
VDGSKPFSMPPRRKDAARFSRWHHHLIKSLVELGAF